MIRITIAMGGIGQRLKCSQKGLSSKAFLKINGKTLLEILINNIIDAFGNDAEIYLAITNEKQEKELEYQEYLKNVNYKIIYNKEKIFDLIKPNVNNLLIFCDTYMKKNIFSLIYENFLKSNKSQFISLNTYDGIDNIVFEVDENNKLISFEKGKQIKEISQVFLFNVDDSNTVYNSNKLNINRFEIIYNHIMKKKDCYVFNVENDCFNINTENDLNDIID